MSAVDVLEGLQRGFHRYDATTRANRAASHRLRHRQKESVGEEFWTHDLLPGICFPTRAAAIRAAIARATGAKT